MHTYSIHWYIMIAVRPSSAQEEFDGLVNLFPADGTVLADVVCPAFLAAHLMAARHEDNLRSRTNREGIRNTTRGMYV